MTILEAINSAIESPTTIKGGDRFRTLLKQLKVLGIDLNLEVDFLNNEKVFKSLVNAVYKGKADLGKGAISPRNFRDSLNTVINAGKSEDRASILESKKISDWMDKNFGTKNVGQDRFIPTDDVAYQQASDTFIKRTVRRAEKIVTPFDTVDTLYEKVQNKLIKPHQINKAIRDLSLKNYFILKSTTGLRATEILDMTVRKNISEQDIKAGKRPYRIEDGIVRNVGLKGQNPMRINYPFGNYHQAVMEDQIRLAALNKALVADRRPPFGDNYNQSFTNELWPNNRQDTHRKLGNNLRPTFLEYNMEWMHEDTSITKTFQVKMLRNQFSRLMEATVDGNTHKIARSMGHVQGSTKEKFYSRVPISNKSLQEMQKKIPLEARKVTTSVASDLDNMIKTVYTDSFERTTPDLVREHGIDRVKGEIGKKVTTPEQFNLNLQQASVTEDPTPKTEDVKEIESRIQNEDKISKAAQQNVLSLQDNYKNTGVIPEGPQTPADKPLTKKQEAKKVIEDLYTNFGEDEYRQDIEIVKKQPEGTMIGHNLQEATSEEVDQIVKDTGADIKTPSGKAQVVKALGMIGKKLPVIGAGFGAYGAITTMKADAAEFEAPEGGDLASMLFGLETGEERQKARAAYQQIESLPFAPMFIPPAESVFPTEQEREEEREQTGAQMEALFTGA